VRIAESDLVGSAMLAAAIVTDAGGTAGAV
jgi:hypothetical protein